MSKVIDGASIGKQVLDALGLGHLPIADFSIHFPLEGLVIVKAEIHADGDRLIELVSEFHGHSKDKIEFKNTEDTR